MAVETRRHAHFPQPLAHYAKFYAVSRQSICSWIRHGKLSGKLPPLQNPTEFPAWYEAHVGVVPDALLQLCLNGGATGNGAQDESGAAAPLSAERFSDAKGLDI